MVTSRIIDDSCSVLAGLQLDLTERLGWVLRSAAHVDVGADEIVPYAERRPNCVSQTSIIRRHLIGHIPKYISVSTFMCDVLHWPPVSKHISFRIAALVWRCLTGCTPS